MLFKSLVSAVLLFVSINAFSASEQLIRQEVSRFFKLTEAINVEPVKKRVGVLINRKLRHNNSGLRQVHYQAVESVVAREIDRLTSEEYFFEQYYQIYKEHYSLDELRQINAFFESQAGRKFIQSRTEVHQDVSTTTVKMIHRLVDDIAPKVQQSLASAGYDVDI